MRDHPGLRALKLLGELGWCCPMSEGVPAGALVSRQRRSEGEELIRSHLLQIGRLFLWARTHERIDSVCAIFALRQVHAEQMTYVCRGVVDPAPVTVWVNGEGYTYKSAEELRPDRQPEQDPDDRYASPT